MSTSFAKWLTSTLREQGMPEVADYVDAGEEKRRRDASVRASGRAQRRSFVPAPRAERCWAVIYRGNYGFAGRCPYRRTEASDLCGRHLKREQAGHVVERVVLP